MTVIKEFFYRLDVHVQWLGTGVGSSLLGKSALLLMAEEHFFFATWNVVQIIVHFVGYSSESLHYLLVRDDLCAQDVKGRRWPKHRYKRLPGFFKVFLGRSCLFLCLQFVSDYWSHCCWLHLACRMDLGPFIHAWRFLNIGLRLVLFKLCLGEIVYVLRFSCFLMLSCTFIFIQWSKYC